MPKPTAATTDFYIVSMSSRTIVYKGMFLAYQVGAYYKDLTDPRFESALALVHQRFSTNTFPSWKLAHPYRMVAHNGEINTLRGNVNWMAARQASVESVLFGKDISKLWPISYEGQSDTACFDNALEFLWRGGYSLAHAVMMLIPEAWAGNPLMDEERRAFYEYHAALMEPWDGPAAVCLHRWPPDRRDARPQRPASGALPRHRRRSRHHGVGSRRAADRRGDDRREVAPAAGQDAADRPRRGPHHLRRGDQVETAPTSIPIASGSNAPQIILEDLKPVEPRALRADVTSLLDRQQAFGYTQEDIKILMAPMATTGQEAIGSMGNDTPISALSDKSKLLYTYFKQNFAQVTNPPIDPIREELVMSLVSFIGPRPNILDHAGASTRKRLEVRQPILTNAELEKIRSIGHTEDRFDTKTIDITYGAAEGTAGMQGAVDRLCERAEAAVAGGYNIIILSDRQIGSDRIPIPSLLACAAVHHHLIRKGLRTSVGLVVETGEPREVHHFCCLAGYGAEAINPYLAFETIEAMLPELDAGARRSRKWCRATSRRSARASSRSCPRWASRPISPIAARRFSMRSASGQISSSNISPAPTPRSRAWGWRRSRARPSSATAKPSPTRRCCATRSMSAANMPTACAAKSHAWTPDAVAALQHAVRGNMRAKRYERICRR